MKDIFQELQHYVAGLSVMNTHSHHLQDQAFQGFNLDKILSQSYVNWNGVPIYPTYESRVDYLKKNRFNSSFVWIHKGIQELYGFTESLSAENWDAISAEISRAYEDKHHHLRVLQDACHYEKVILDTYWEPGSDHGHPEIFAPTFRINSLLFGYSPDAKDHNGHSPKTLYDYVPKDLDEYVSFIEDVICAKQEQGCVALKCATAYERGLDFEAVSREVASGVLRKPPYEQSPMDVKNFQDYIFEQICQIAAKVALPLQIHTGMGLLAKTRAMELQNVIGRKPDTKFVLFHCSYPWMDDIHGLLRVYPNVYPDLCWLPLLSTSAAIRMLHELIDGGTADKVCWGCDTWTSEESYGALLAIRHVIATVLASKVEEGYFSLEDAFEMADNLLWRNAKRLYGV